MKKLSFLIMFIMVLGIIVVDCERHPTQTEATFTENLSQTESLGKVTVISDENYKFDWEALNCPEGTPGCEQPECVWVPCITECMELSGTTHVRRKAFLDASGGMHMHFHVHDSNVKAIGLETNTKYVCLWTVNRGFYRVTIVPGTFPFIIHHKQNLRIISQGNAPNYQVSFMLHITVNADGTMTVRRIVEKVDCE